MSSLGGLDQVSILHLRYFLTVIDEGTVRAAAARIGISQPSLSQQLSKLERRVGVRLFERTPAGMHATEAGRQLAATVAPALHAIRALGAAATVSLRIGAPRGLPADIYQLLRDRLGASIEFVRVNTSRAVAAIGSGQIDAAIVRGPLSDEYAGFSAEVLVQQPVGVLVSEHNPIAVPGCIDWPDLAGQRLLWFDEDRAPLFAEALLRHSHRNGWNPELVRLDPAGSEMIGDALRNTTNLVTLRPAPDPVPVGLVWRQLHDPPIEQIYLIGAECRYYSVWRPDGRRTAP